MILSHKEYFSTTQGIQSEQNSFTYVCFNGDKTAGSVLDVLVQF